MVLIGFGSILMAATGNTTIQLAVPDHLRGRVMSVYTTVFSASVPIGGIAMGAIASAFGVPVAIAVGGVLTLVVGFGALAWGRRGAFALGRQPGARADRPAGMVPGRRPPALTSLTLRAAADLALDGPEHERGVEPAEPERRRQHAPVGAVAAGPQQARQERRDLGIRVVEVDRGRRPAVADRQRADRGLDRARRTERMAVERLGAADRHGRRPAPRAPSAIARASATSPIGVDEAWALT